MFNPKCDTSWSHLSPLTRILFFCLTTSSTTTPQPPPPAFHSKPCSPNHFPNLVTSNELSSVRACSTEPGTELVLMLVALVRPCSAFQAWPKCSLFRKPTLSTPLDSSLPSLKHWYYVYTIFQTEVHADCLYCSFSGLFLLFPSKSHCHWKQWPSLTRLDSPQFQQVSYT